MNIEVNKKIFKLNDYYKNLEDNLIYNCLKNNGELIFENRDIDIFEYFILPLLNGELIDEKVCKKLLLQKFDYDIRSIINYVNQCLYDELNYFNLYILNIHDDQYKNNIIKINNIIKTFLDMYTYMLQLEIYIKSKKDNTIYQIINNKYFDIPFEVIEKIGMSLGFKNIEIFTFETTEASSSAFGAFNEYIFEHYIYRHKQKLKDENIIICKQDEKLLEKWVKSLDSEVSSNYFIEKHSCRIKDNINDFINDIIREVEYDSGIKLEEILKLVNKYKMNDAIFVRIFYHNDLLNLCKRNTEVYSALYYIIMCAKFSK